MIAVDPKNPRGIVWLASYPKSGNTWLRMFLYQLARIRLGHPKEDDEINKLGRVSVHEMMFDGIYQRFLGKPMAEATPEEIVSARPQVQAAIAEHAPGVVFLKTHSIRALRDGIPTINPAVCAGAIYLVRDPRDVAVSLQRHTGRSLDFSIDLLNRRNAYAFGTVETWGSWSQNVESWTAGADGTLLVIRYEDMLAGQDAAFAAVLNHVGQGATPDELAEAIRCSSFDEMREQENRHGFQEKHPASERFFVEGKTGGWRDVLTPTHVNSIIAAHGPMMRKFGYLE